MKKSTTSAAVLAIAVISTLSGPALARAPENPTAWGGVVAWTDNGPVAREHPSLMVFDGKVVVYGGSGYEPQGAPLGDAWEFDPNESSWRTLELQGDVPGAAGSRRVAQAPGSDHAWLFGGYGANFATNNELYRVVKHGETLTFTRIEQTNPPEARALHAFAVDPNSGSLIVSHGVSQAGFMGDTHIGRLEADGRVRWQPFQSVSGPGPRFGFAYGFDTDLGELIIFSGQTPGSEGNPMPMSDETWAFRSRGPTPGWARIEAASPLPPGRRNPMFAFDDLSDRLLVWCGTADARSNIPGIVTVARDRDGSWVVSQFDDEGAPPRRSSGIGFFDAKTDRAFFGFGNSRAGRYQEWVTLRPSALGETGEHRASAKSERGLDEDVSSDAVENAIREYVIAKYSGDADGVRSRAHPSIARRAVASTYWGRPSDEWIRPYSHDVLQFYGTRANETRTDSPQSGRCEIVVHDVEARTAAATVIMEDVVDYLHLVRFDGRWVIADSAVYILDRAGAEPPPVSREDEPAIRKVVRDYCMGFYEIDGDKVQETCHPILSKRTVERWAEEPAFDYFRSITWEEIRILGNTFNRRFGFDPDTARCEIDVYEIRGNMALAKLTASVWFDYFQLMKVGGEWKIVNIMFEPLPEERSEAP